MRLGILDFGFWILDDRSSPPEKRSTVTVAARPPKRISAGHSPAESASSLENRKSKIKKAFTLIELMIVISIVAIIITMGVPPFVRALRKEGLRKAVSDVVEGCSHARAEAILHGLPMELIIRAEDGQISVRPLPTRRLEETAEGGLPEPAPVVAPAASGAANFTGRLPDDIAVRQLDVNFEDQMEFSEAHVRFFPNGTCDEFTVTLSSATAEQQISLDVITGLANVKVIK
jgi:prepilin-type N-terminal cleavage/methylation domain-containing protein